MNIAGLQKLTLLDFPGKTACTVFTDGCNFRCPFCQNSSLLSGRMPAFMDHEAFFDFLRKRKGLLDGVCLTGGEPLVHPSVTDFIARIKEEGFAVKLDTNGSFPDRLFALIDRSLLDYVAMDLKNSFDRYPETVGIPSYDVAPVRQSVALLLGGKVPYEFRTTVVKELHTPRSMADAAAAIKGASRYFLQAFRASDEVLTPGLHAYSDREMTEILSIVRQFVPNAELRGI